jgi:SAM-dependent MidA family methyltransferase
MKTPETAIRAEIRKQGPLPFARFMELALYHPQTGYYETRQNTVGRRGDFITSVSTGELFGQLLAFQFGEWLENLRQKQSNKCFILEAGAHDGKLAADILRWLRDHRPALGEEIDYILLEPSPARQQWQRETLKEFDNVRWYSDFENLKLKTQNSELHGVLFSNELLDAFPVHRLGWNAKDKKWFEWGVSLDGEKFEWSRINDHAPPIPPAILNLPSSLLEILPDNFTIETSPAAQNWWRDAANLLTHGKLLTIDYGYTAEEQFSPARTRGTLRAYQRHRVSDDLLAHPGEQDLTAHVNFSAIQKAGEAAGLITEDFCPQPQFLTRIFSAAVKQNKFTPLDAKQVRQFQTLTHPDHLGRAFRVLVQAR